ncbi:sensor domain-containing diguanylate cyclase [Luteimonas salinilitoris]|uniref:diguanylate cyclase n=1 Tax=Luteimonas salinilitoris TaxID=3237697 RepID=A0ABV4HM24_9GAMM
MKSNHIHAGLMLACLLGVAAHGVAASEFKQILEHADQIRTSDPKRFREVLLELDRIADTATPQERRHLQMLQAYRMTMSGEMAKAISGLESLIESPDADLETRFRAGSFLANTYALTRDFNKGMVVLEATLALEDRIESQELRSQAYLSATVLYNQVGQYGLGQHYAEKVIDTEPDGRLRCFSQNLRLEALQGQGQASDDAAYFDAIEQCNAIGEPIGTNLVRTYLARKWHDDGRTAQALDLLKQHLDEVIGTQYKHLIGEFNALIAEYSLALGQVEAAESHANSALAESEGFLHTLPLVTAYKVLYSIAESRGESDAALKFHRRYADADKAHLNEAKARELAYQLVRHETLQKNQQIELLDQRNRVLELQQKVVEKSAQNTQLIALLLVAVLGSIGYWAYKTKRLQVRLRRMAEIDMLTGICNRHHFTQKAERALALCAKAGEAATLVMFDLDHFKQINDRFGHPAGDCALRHVAAACLSLCRPVDCFGRLGGEEFGILLPGCDLRDGERLAEACIARLAAIHTADCGHVFEVTASFGVTCSAHSGYDLNRMLSHADKALYRAKRAGRNRLRVYADETPRSTVPAGVAEDPESARSVALS